jgi:uncharacterized membrane protein YagU involved in acid resistance
LAQAEHWRVHCGVHSMNVRFGRDKLYKGCIAGAIGGLAASWVMTRFQFLLSRTHYTFGAGIGALYGGLAQKHETTTSGFGSAYGAAAWAFGDEIAVPVLGLGKKPTETPLSVQCQFLAAHLVDGGALEGVRRLALKTF